MQLIIGGKDNGYYYPIREAWEDINLYGAYATDTSRIGLLEVIIIGISPISSGDMYRQLTKQLKENRCTVSILSDNKSEQLLSKGSYGAVKIIAVQPYFSEARESFECKVRFTFDPLMQEF